MAQPSLLDAASSARKVLELELRKGLNDTAVVGGLERFAQALQQRARGLAGAPVDGNDGYVGELLAVAGMLAGYSALPSSRRRQIVATALERLRALEQKLRGQPARLQRLWSETSPPGPLSRAAGEGEPHGSELGFPPRASAPRQASSAAAPRQEGKPEEPSPAPEAASKQRRRGLPSTATGRLSGSVAEVITAPSNEERARRVAQLERIGIQTVGDLLYHFPRRHLDRSSFRRIAELSYGEVATVYGRITNIQRKRTPRQGIPIIEATIADETGFLRATWFNKSPRFQHALAGASHVIVSGKVKFDISGAPAFQEPEIDFDPERAIHSGRIVPVYPLTGDLDQWTMRRAVSRAIEYYVHQLVDHLPEDVRRRAGLLPLAEAVAQMHFPDSWERWDQARRRLAFDELLLVQLGVQQRRREWQEQPGNAMKIDPALLERYRQSLPFELTRAQQRVIDEILADMAKPVPMSRLLQGEVGSGKTVVAGAAIAVACANGFQAAMMAPTEILAQQHYATLSRLLEPLGLRVRLLSGSLKKREKEEIWQLAASGEVDVLVGTHALIEDGEFKALGLVIVDEQHRFGVRQRANLRNKGYNPDVLVMTATPIPRTLALTIYGDLDISVIDELPPGRQRVKTRWVGPRERMRAYAFVREQVRQGHQAFIICPLIEESDRVDARAAIEEHARLQRQIFPDLKLELLHGRMSAKEKEAVMQRFRDGEAHILVSTPVVEVGIDVPNATVMLIEGADRFGLAQLHQFRGRVGRGPFESYCLLLSDSSNPDENPRLRAIVENYDGFKLAEEDLKLRGPGEFFGTRQSGLPDLKVAQLGDIAVLELARREAALIFAADPELRRPEHALLAEKMQAFWATRWDAARE